MKRKIAFVFVFGFILTAGAWAGVLGYGFKVPTIDDVANVTAPVKGELLYDDSDSALQVYNGSTWNMLSAATQRIFTAKHDANCGWTVTNTSFTSPSADASCDYTAGINQNFGTVAAYLSSGDDLPGITWTPAATGYYNICATINLYGDVSESLWRETLRWNDHDRRSIRHRAIW